MLLLPLLTGTVAVVAGGEREAANAPKSEVTAEAGDQWILSLQKMKGDNASGAQAPESSAVADPIAAEVAIDAETADLDPGLVARYGSLEAISLETAAAYLHEEAQLARFAENIVDPQRKSQYLKASRHAHQLAEAMKTQGRWLKELRALDDVEPDAIFLERLEEFAPQEVPVGDASGADDVITGNRSVKRPEQPASPVPFTPPPVDEPRSETLFNERPAETGPSRPRVYSSWTDIHDAIRSLKTN